MRIPLEDEQTLTLTASIGVAFARGGDEKDMDDLISRADKALYLAKSAGRNRAICDKVAQREREARTRTIR